VCDFPWRETCAITQRQCMGTYCPFQGPVNFSLSKLEPLITRASRLLKVFSSDNFNYYFTLDDLNRVLSVWQVKKEKKAVYCSPKRWIYLFISTLLLNSFFKIKIDTSLSLAALEVKCAWYLHSFSSLISLHPVISFELLITQAFIYSPRRFKLSGVDCIFMIVDNYINT